MNKHRIFIGSSTEGLDVAYAIQQNLEHFAEVTIWTQGVFQLSTSILTNLIQSLNKFDFAIFVFSPDDITNFRGDELKTVRDNVIFETGLFAGKLGVERVYFIKPRNQSIHLPTDLLGIVAGEYEPNRSDKNLIAATGAFCNQVRQKIKDSINTLDQNDNRANLSTIMGLDKQSLEKDLKMITVFMKDKGWTSMSFQKISENINPRFTEQHVMQILEAFPERIRRQKLQQKHGIKLLD
ncbi:MAG: nucleotide-binding protein [Bacteroidota bacterium]